MSEVMEVAAIRALLVPMFREVLHDDEFRSLEFWIMPTDDPHGGELEPDAVVERNGAVVWWAVLGEGGASGGLWVDEGAEVLVRQVQSDLQDFIAESRFGWGQLRGPLPDGS